MEGDSKDGPWALLRGGPNPGLQQGLGPSTWQHWPDVQPGPPVSSECPREGAVEALLRSEQGRRWLREISDGLRLNSSLRDLLRRRIRFLFIQGGRVARDLGMVDVDERLIAALDSLRGDVWSCVLRDSTSLVTLLLSLDPSVLDGGLGCSKAEELSPTKRHTGHPTLMHKHPADQGFKLCFLLGTNTRGAREHPPTQKRPPDADFETIDVVGGIHIQNPPPPPDMHLGVGATVGSTP